ncbi:hypothetical protein [Cupriavidus oxalaticus]|uniref:hypothetical protein n=1 Tax=Cupriavidus TaxID=106589 RepID=UPI001F115D1C|nr:hypothetical protein [Cupriavidus oxalaticus]
MTLVADADARKVVFLTEGKEAATVGQFAEHLREHNAFARSLALGDARSLDYQVFTVVLAQS